jgi:Fur family transcriptional regulator, ferric uptake regulator
VMEIDPSTFDPVIDRLRSDLGFETDVQHLTVFGTCRECS